MLFAPASVLRQAKLDNSLSDRFHPNPQTRNYIGSLFRWYPMTETLTRLSNFPLLEHLHNASSRIIIKFVDVDVCKQADAFPRARLS